MEEGGDAPEEAEQEVDLPEQIPLLDTQSPDVIRSITKWESMCSRSSTWLTCAPQP